MSLVLEAQNPVDHQGDPLRFLRAPCQVAFQKAKGGNTPQVPPRPHMFIPQGSPEMPACSAPQGKSSPWQVRTCYQRGHAHPF